MEALMENNLQNTILFLLSTIIFASIGSYIYRKYLRKEPPKEPPNQSVKRRRRK